MLAWILVAIVSAAFGVAWWLVFRAVRRYPNSHNFADDYPFLW